MRISGTILLTAGTLLSDLNTQQAQPLPLTNTVVVSTELIRRLAEEARTNSPALRAARARVNGGELHAEAVRSWEDSRLMFGGRVFSSRGFAPSEEGDLVYGFDQKLPLWGKLKATRQVAEAGASMRRAEAQLRYEQLIRQITKGLLTTALAGWVVEIGEQDLAWLQTTATATESRYRSGQAVMSDALQIQNEVAKRDDALRTDHHRLVHERVSLNRLLNREVDALWPPLQLPHPAPAVPFSEKLVSLALRSA